MLPNSTIILITATVVALLFGWLMGWLIARSSYRNRKKLLQTSLDDQTEETGKLLTAQEQLKTHLETFRQQAEENAAEKISLQATWEEQLQRLKEMMAERDRLNELIDSLSHERSDAKELAAALKTRNDETQRLVIDQRNDYLRLKAQSELWPQEREKLLQEIAVLKDGSGQKSLSKTT